MINSLDYYLQEGASYARQRDTATRTFLYQQFQRARTLEDPKDRPAIDRAWEEGRKA